MSSVIWFLLSGTNLCDPVAPVHKDQRMMILAKTYRIDSLKDTLAHREQLIKVTHEILLEKRSTFFKHNPVTCRYPHADVLISIGIRARMRIL